MDGVQYDLQHSFERRAMNTQEYYLKFILSGIQWGLNDECPAWNRTIDHVNNNQDLYDLFGINETKSELKREAPKYLESWMQGRFKDGGSDGFEAIEPMSPEDLWIEMVLNNSKPFGSNQDPLQEFLIPEPSKVRNTAPLWLKPNIDGWGIKPD